jgi:ABC-2 type transport system ATP-binding protein
MEKATKAAIKVSGLTKHFGAVKAVGGVDFEVFPGELFGFLGPNGAGKTTTINMLTGLARPDAGTIRIGGIDCSKNPRAAQHLVGVVPDESNLYPELTGFENLCFCAALYGMGKAEREVRAELLLAAFGLAKAAKRKFGGYSKGMKRRLTIAAGIVHRPKILFLDEPTTGIDVAGARQLRQLISDLHADGTTIFLTTHYIEEAERLCDRIAFIVDGRIVAIDKVVDLLNPLQDKQILQVSFANSEKNMDPLLAARFPDVEFSFADKGRFLAASNNPIGVGPLVRFLEDNGLDVDEARRLKPSLEDVFMRITGLEATVMKTEKEERGKKP